MKLTFTEKEIKEIAIASVVLSLAFSLSWIDGIFNIASEWARMPFLFLFSFIAVGTGFLAHELIGHKLIAQHYGMYAEFKMWSLGLFLSFLTSLFGIVIAAPGAVYISPRIDLWGQETRITKRNMGIVSVAGPLINIAVASVFFILNYFISSPLFSIGIFVNIWLALFNMIPFPPLDGSKVFFWNKKIWVAVFGLCIVLFLTANVLII
ncbi:MAG: hypothetical protein N3D84_03460 [Candidatus Woesearchaeota archaeon]|nr:hypothetical protein [Candidatus Woesearchaeota archaeon]